MSRACIQLILPFYPFVSSVHIDPGMKGSEFLRCRKLSCLSFLKSSEFLSGFKLYCLTFRQRRMA